MYAMTVVGTKARLRVVNIEDDFLVPWIFKSTSLSDKFCYIEAHSSEGHQIEDGINYTKEHAEMP